MGSPYPVGLALGLVGEARPEGLTIDQLGDMNELYISSEYFIGYARLRANQASLTGM